MPRFSLWILLLALGASLGLSTSARAQGAASGVESSNLPTLISLSRELICPCPDCGGKSLDLCESTCKLGQERRDTISSQLRLGKSHDQVIQFMSSTYGPQILGEPPREGWGILSLAMPVACLAAGAMPLLWFTRGRSIGGPRRAARRRAVAAPAEDERVQAALRDFDF